MLQAGTCTKSSKSEISSPALNAMKNGSKIFYIIQSKSSIPDVETD